MSRTTFDADDMAVAQQEGYEDGYHEALLAARNVFESQRFKTVEDVITHLDDWLTELEQ